MAVLPPSSRYCGPRLELPRPASITFVGGVCVFEAGLSCVVKAGLSQ